MSQLSQFLLVYLLACSFPLFGKLVISDEPIAVIEKGFSTPEGVAFSPSGNCLAVVCASDHSLSVYKRLDDARYTKEPTCVIRSRDFLRYAHDVDFSPCGKYIAVASKEVNKVVFFQFEDEEACLLQTEPCSKLEKIKEPASLSYAGNILGVSSRMGDGIFFYKKLEAGHYEASPSYKITEEQLLQHGLSAPHGIALSPDGKWVAIIHKKYCKRKNAGGEPGFSLFGISGDAEFHLTPALVDTDKFSIPHSVDFHPSMNYIAMTDEEGSLRVYEKDGQQFKVSYESPKKHVKRGEEEGYRGIAFSQDGKFMAITTRQPAVLIYEVGESQ